MRKVDPINSYPRFHPAAILFVGLLIAQVVAVIQVYLSNPGLHKTMTAISEAGYLAVPNPVVMSSLQSFWTAFWGGWFFTISIGAGVSLAGMAAGWIWSRLFLRSRPALFVWTAVWGGLLLVSNWHGPAVFPTLYLVLTAPAIFWLTAKLTPRASIKAGAKLDWLHLAPIPILALLWFPQLDADLFMDLRDNLLLSNHLGEKISHYYYRYTLYPAKSFKSLDQKIIRTCRLDDLSSPGLKRQLAEKLLANDYLPMPDIPGANLIITRAGPNLVFRDGDRQVLNVKTAQFLARPQQTLQRYSAQRDRHRALRQFSFLSLLMGFPVLVYLVLHAILYYPAAFIFSRKAASLTASALCLMIGLLVLFYFQANRSRNIRVENIHEALVSQSVSRRVAALKTIRRKGLRVADFSSYPQLLKSPHPSERYWLVVAMAIDRSQATFSDLVGFLEDENINVRCMALQALGRQKNPQAIKIVLAKLKTSHDWYAQVYAYRALRSLGWKQKRLS